MKILEFYHSNYRQDTTFKAQKSGESKLYAVWQSSWMSKFQRNPYAKCWVGVREKLLVALKRGEVALVKECILASQIASEFSPDKLPAVVIWGIKRACSTASAQEVYDLLNVKLTVKDIRGESFYAGFPNPTETDVELGKLLNELEIF